MFSVIYEREKLCFDGNNTNKKIYQHQLHFQVHCDCDTEPHHNDIGITKAAALSPFRRSVITTYNRGNKEKEESRLRNNKKEDVRHDEPDTTATQVTFRSLKRENKFCVAFFSASSKQNT